jgi:hypothetical protein
VIVFPERTVSWNGDISEAGLAEVFAPDAGVDLLLLG